MIALLCPRALLGLLLAAGPLLAAVPLAAQDNTVRVGPEIEEMIFGTYCAQEPLREVPAPDTAGGHVNVVPAVPLITFQQQVVPAQIGIGFGVISRAPAGVVYDPVIVTVIHPPFLGSGAEVESWTTEIDAGDNLTGFSFDFPHELVTGRWSFTAALPDGTELYHVTFEVVAPELAPQVVAACFDTLTS